MKLDLTSLQKAVASLDRAIRVTSSKVKMARLQKDQKDIMRAGVVQNFEFTYELCWKFMQRWLQGQHGEKDADLPRTRKELFRQAARWGLIRSPSQWFRYRDVRNLTAHTYNEKTAISVSRAAKVFVKDAQALLAWLEMHND